MAAVARATIRFRYLVIAAWLVLGVATILLLPSLSSVVNTDNSSFLPSDQPSARATQLATPFLPASDSAATMVVTTSSPKLTSSEQSAVTSLEGQLAKLDHVVSVTDQGPSGDGKAVKALLVVDAMRSTAADAHLPSTLTVRFTGSLPSAVDNQSAQASAEQRTQLLSNLVILVML